MNNSGTNNSEMNKYLEKEGVEVETKGKAAGQEIHMLHHAVSRYLAYNAKAYGIDEITMMHGWILKYLYENRDREIFQKDIEKTFSIGRSTVTSLIQLLEKKGYIQRESVAQDARLKRVFLTEKGIKNNESIKRMFNKMNEAIEKDIDEKELDVFFRVCDKIKKNLKDEKFRCKEGGIRCFEEF